MLFDVVVVVLLLLTKLNGNELTHSKAIHVIIFLATGDASV